MDHSQLCNFCAVATRGHKSPLIEDSVLDESRHFVAIPSLGALVPGYVLVVPRAHVLNLGLIDPEQRSDFEGLVARLSEQLVASGSRFLLFEHGPAAPGTPIGCSVDHAHLHVVPFDLPLEHNDLLLAYEWEEVRNHSAVIRPARDGRGYVFLRDSTGRSFLWISNGDNEPSQLVRRAIAAALGMPDQFDWRSSPFIENVGETVRRMRRTVLEEETLKDDRGTRAWVRA